MPKISLIIPVHNHLPALKNCLTSLLGQTFRDYEIILVNDGSTDSLNFWLSEFMAAHPDLDLKIFAQSRRGAPHARNYGFDQSTGEYVIFCDADLILHSTMLAHLLYTIENHPQAAYTYCSFKRGWKLFTLWPFDPQRLRQMPYIPTATLIRRSSFPGFDSSLEKFQDWDLWLTMLERGDIGVWLPEILFQAQTRGRVGISSWLPSIAYRIPWQKFGLRLKLVDQYYSARQIILQKHNLA